MRPLRPGGDGTRLLCVVTGGRVDASGRKRIYDLAPLWRRAGHDVRIISHDWEWLWRVRGQADAGGRAATALLRIMNASRLTPVAIRTRVARNFRRFARLVEWADVVIVNQSTLDDNWRSVLRSRARAVVYDVDDAVWLQRGAEADMFALADLVVAGNAYIADWVGAFHPMVRTIPTVVRLDRYERRPPVRRPRGGPCVVGWVGSPSTAQYLQMLEEPLAVLGTEVPVTLEIIGTEAAELPRFRNVTVRLHPRVPYDPVDFVPQFDIGVMPLIDGEWERGKCAAKALEYMAGAVPVVCSDVGESSRVVEDGVCGLLARNSGEWLAALRRLALDENLRQTMGRAGRERVRAAYSGETAVTLWAQVLTQLRQRQFDQSAGSIPAGARHAHESRRH